MNNIVPDFCKGCIYVSTCRYVDDGLTIEKWGSPFAISCNLKKSVDEVLDEEIKKKAAKVDAEECCTDVNESEPKAYFIQNAVGQASFHGETWYKCPYCDFTFEYWDAVYEYNGIKRTSELDQYICPKCKKVFNVK